MWRDLNGPSTFGWMQLNCNDSKPNASSDLLVEVLKRDPTVTSNFPYKLRCSSTL